LAVDKANLPDVALKLAHDKFIDFSHTTYAQTKSHPNVSGWLFKQACKKPT
jgi:hypothetical protein